MVEKKGGHMPEGGRKKRRAEHSGSAESVFVRV